MVRSSRVCSWQEGVEIQVKVKYCEAEMSDYLASEHKGITTPGWVPESSQNVDKQLGRLLVAATRKCSVNLKGGILLT